jgi:hypothetical protein
MWSLFASREPLVLLPAIVAVIVAINLRSRLLS